MERACGRRRRPTPLLFSPSSAAAAVAFIVVAAAWTRRGSLPPARPALDGELLPGGSMEGAPADHHDAGDTPATPAAAAHHATPAARATPAPTPHETPAPADASATAACALAPAAPESRALVAGASNGQPSASACRDACAATPGCNVWTWCFDEGGCALLGGGPGAAAVAVPNLGCHLAAEPLAPRGGPSPAHVASLAPSSHVTGYVKTRRPAEETYVRLHSAPTPRVLLATELPPRSGGGCPAQHGDELALLHLWNKQDYARWHSYDVALVTTTLDSSLHPAGGTPGGQWNKVALLARMLAETPPGEAEWIFYQFFDALIDDVGFTFPFDSYADKDLILVGDAASVLAGDASKLDTGALLLRNGAWARAFVQRLEHDIKRSAQPPADVVARSDLVAAAITRALQERPEDAERVRERGREGGRRAAGPPPSDPLLPFAHRSGLKPISA